MGGGGSGHLWLSEKLRWVKTSICCFNKQNKPQVKACLRGQRGGCGRKVDLKSMWCRQQVVVGLEPCRLCRLSCLVCVEQVLLEQLCSPEVQCTIFNSPLVLHSCVLWACCPLSASECSHVNHCAHLSIDSFASSVKTWPSKTECHRQSTATALACRALLPSFVSLQPLWSDWLIARTSYLYFTSFKTKSKFYHNDSVKSSFLFLTFVFYLLHLVCLSLL